MDKTQLNAIRRLKAGYLDNQSHYASFEDYVNIAWRSQGISNLFDRDAKAFLQGIGYKQGSREYSSLLYKLTDGAQI